MRTKEDEALHEADRKKTSPIRKRKPRPDFATDGSPHRNRAEQRRTSVAGPAKIDATDTVNT
jgi:hypothetical protein